MILAVPVAVGEGLECASGSRPGSKTTNKRLCATAARRASRNWRRV